MVVMKTEDRNGKVVRLGDVVYTPIFRELFKVTRITHGGFIQVIETSGDHYAYLLAPHEIVLLPTDETEREHLLMLLKLES